MLRFLLCSAVLVSLGLTAPALGAGGSPQLLQTVTRDDEIIDLAVSPGGSRLAVITPGGLTVYAVDPQGVIRASPVIKQIAHTKFWRVAFGPGEKRLLVATYEQELRVYEVSDWSLAGTVDLGPDGHDPEALFVLEDPSLVLVKGRESASPVVANYRKLSKPVEIIPHPYTHFHKGRCLVSRPDASRVFYSAEAQENPPKYVVFGETYKVPGQLWVYLAPTEPLGMCVGPGPDYLLLSRRSGGEITILDLATGAAVTGCTLATSQPYQLKLTNDGYYAVVADSGTASLTVISGHDLRGRLDPDFGLSAENVRRASLDLQGAVNCLALHPTLPLAYVGMSNREIRRVKLAIPGIEHP